eukprot:1853512-Prymnesium_polylepis.3
MEGTIGQGDCVARCEAKGARERRANSDDKAAQRIDEDTILVQMRQRRSGERIRRHKEEDQRLRSRSLVTDARRANARGSHTRQRAHGIFKLVAMKVGTTHDEHLLRAAREHELPIVEEAEVARVEPAIAGEALGVGSGMVEVAWHNACAANLQTTYLPLLEHHILTASWSHDAYLDPG